MLQYVTMTKTASSQKGDSLGNDPLMGLQDSQFSNCLWGSTLTSMILSWVYAICPWI